MQAGSTVVQTTGVLYEVFVESGAAKMTLREGAPTVSRLSTGDFA
jgi:hypothetical protein